MDRNEADQEVVMSQSAHDALMEKAKAEGTLAATQAKAAGATEGRAAERDRFKAILADDKIKGKEAIALDLAIKSPDMKAEDIVAFVAGLSVESAKAPGIAERMRGQGAALSLGGPVREAPNPTPKINAADVYVRRAKAAAA